MADLLLGLLSQLVGQDSSLLDFFYRELGSIDQQKLTLHKLSDLVLTALRAQRRCFIVVDGLDECARDPVGSKPNEAERVLKWFEELIPPKGEAVTHPDDLCIRLLVSGQRDGYLEERLGSYPSIQLETTAAHGEDIKSYAKAEAARICNQFSAGREVEQDIVQKVTTKAKGCYTPAHTLLHNSLDSLTLEIGMFLFAKIVLENLFDQISTFDFEYELKAENFPEGLDKAYVVICEGWSSEG